ncbi:MAG: nucleotidyltransferase family protein [Gaiellaceae bacterium]
MKAVILAAGYATRLYPLTLDRPKPLLEVGGRPMVEHVLDAIAPIEGIDRVVVVTNAKFAPQFDEWAEGYGGREVTVLDDGTADEETKHGAIGDLDLAIRELGIDDDLLVIAGDNLFSESLGDFGRECRARNAPVLALYDVGDLAEMHKYNAIETDDEGRIVFFEEKPADPSTTLTGIALYFYPRAVVPEIRRYLDEGNNPDQPGRLVQWLYPQLPFYTWRVPGIWFDIGSRETLAEADEAFSAHM